MVIRHRVSSPLCFRIDTLRLAQRKSNHQRDRALSSPLMHAAKLASAPSTELPHVATYTCGQAARPSSHRNLPSAEPYMTKRIERAEILIT